MGNGQLSIQIIHASLWQLLLPPYQRVRFSTVAAYIIRTTITIIIIRVDKRWMDRAAEMIISRWALIIARVTAVRATQIRTTTQRFSRRHQRQFSYNTKRHIRLKSLPWIPTTLSTVIRRAYRRPQVPSCNRCTASRVRQFNRRSTFKILTMMWAQAPRTVWQMPRQLWHQHHRSENVLWILRARKISLELSTPSDLGESAFASNLNFPSSKKNSSL